MSLTQFWQAREIAREERVQERGYRFDYKRVFMAYMIEIVVIVASLFGAWYFAHKYSHDDATFWVMLLAPVGYAVIEFCRVPLAISVRTQRNWGVKIAALLGVVLAAGVTAKSMSQLGYLMFQPRLERVTETKRNYDFLANDRDNFYLKRKSAEAVVEQRKAELDDAGDRAQEATKGLIDRPKPAPCIQTTYVDRRTGKTMHGARCPTETVAPMINERAVQAEADRKEAAAKYEEAQKELVGLDPKAFEDKVTAAQAAKKQAIFDSQLHTFTAMVYGIDPDQVTEGELHWFLRLFVFVPAICVSFASTLLAFTAVEKLRKNKQALFAEDAGAYLVGPLAQAAVMEANRTVERTAADVMREAHGRAAKAAKDAGKPEDVIIEVDEKIIPMGSRA